MAGGLGSRIFVRAYTVAALLLALLAALGCWADGALASESGRVAAGGTHSCTIKVDGTLVCWGGQGGVPAGLGSVEQVAAGGHHDCAIKTDGTPVCWGRKTSSWTIAPRF